MKTRVKPHNELYQWQVDVFDPYNNEWKTISLHDIFWIADWKAKRLSKKKLVIYSNKKEEFIDRLKGIHNE